MSSKLTRVTLTGADDTVDQQDLLEISARFPFVEWGILIGSSHGHRFPSENWMIQLMNCALDTKAPPRLSLHICGAHLRGIAAGKPLQLPMSLLQIFERCQLNWHGEPKGDISRAVGLAFSSMLPKWHPEVIFQLDGKNDTLACECASHMAPKVSGLFDLSHGAGVLPKEWPACSALSAAYRVGYAGGLGPDNLREQLPLIHAVAAGDYWIDMETKLYDGLQFSLEKCIDVLEIVREFNAEAKA